MDRKNKSVDDKIQFMQTVLIGSYSMNKNIF